METLQAMLAQDPRNSFTRYALAMEHVNSGRLDEAVTQFDELIRNDPNYAAAYFHGGQALEKLGRVDDARTMYQAGIDVTSRAGDAHARSELQAALDMLPT